MATSRIVQVIQYNRDGTQIYLNYKTIGSCVSVDRSTNSNIPTDVTNVQKLANHLGSLAFKDTVNTMTGASSGTAGVTGLVPAPASGKHMSFLRGDATWSVPEVFTGATSSTDGTSGFVLAPKKGNQGLFLRGDGTWATPTNTTYSVFKGSTTSVNGESGLVPAPKGGENTYFLRGDGSWGMPADTVYTHPTYPAHDEGLYKFAIDNHGHVVTAEAMTKTDITNLGIPGSNTWRGIQDNLTSSSVSDSLSANQGKVLKGLIDGKASVAHSHKIADITNLQTTLDSKSPTTHTHNYAGSSSAGGSANTALKLATARTVSADVDFHLNFSYDGSANSIATMEYYNAKCVNGNKNNYPYHRIAYSGTVMGQYIDKAITMLITQDYSGGGFGICSVRLRTNSASEVSSAEVKWLCRSGLDAEAIQVGIYNAAGNTYADIFFKTTSAYQGTVIRNLGMGGRGGINRTWTLVNSSEANDTTAGDSKTSSEVYSSVATAAMNLHNRAYSVVVIGIDSRSSDYATTAGTADVAKALSVNGGSTTQPVYFANGKPVATTYSLNKTVPADAKFTDTVYSHPTYTAKSSGLYKVTVDSTGHVSATTAVTKADITALGIPGSAAGTYTHPSYTARSSGLYKVTVDNLGHVSNVANVAKSDITSLGIPGSDTTYGNASQSNSGLMSATDKKKLDTADFLKVQAATPTEACIWCKIDT
jgi:hypothetical protein